MYDRIDKETLYMNVSAQDIYLSKLMGLKTTLESKTAKFEGAVSAFQNILLSIENRLGYVSEADEAASSVLSSAYVQESYLYPDTSVEINAAIEYAARNTGLDPDLIRAVIQTESSFRVNAVSSSGAQGLMQLMPGTAKELGVTNSFDVFQNVSGGSEYLKKQIDRFGDVRLALAAYNTGPARIARLDISDPSDPDEYSKISSGVRGYVEKVLKYYNQYSQSN